ncbi:MAG: PDZ domain-containing protein [Phycisphaerae bacterium]
MKRWITLGLALLVVWPAAVQADTAKVLSDIVAKASGSLVAIKYTVEMETGKQDVTGQGICIEPTGIFLTTALDSRLRAESLKDFQVITSGADGKTLKAKLLGLDPWTGLGFVQATEKHTWQVVQFSRTSKLALSQEVASIGLLMGDPARPVCLGMGYVSAMLRVPGELVRVAGGRLTGPCSPVFSTDGRAIGIVGRQLFESYGVLSRGRVVPMQMRNQQESAFFTPVEEFVHVLENIPSDGKVTRLPWMGVNKFEAVPTDLAEILKLDKPAVKVDEVIPGHPAAKAGLADRDIIIEVNGKEIEKLATPQLSVRNFVRELMRMRTGATLKLKVLSGRETKEVTVTLADMPKRPSEANRYFNKAIGLLVREKVMLDEFLDKSPSASVPGLRVEGVVKGSPAAAADFKAGDVVTNVNNQPVKTIQTLQQIVEQSLTTSRTAPINFLVRRDDQAQVITVKPGG